MARQLWTTWPPDPDGKGIRGIVAEMYKDHGEWARHYSTVRMTLGTFSLTAGAGVISFQLDKPDWRIAALAAMIVIVGAILFLRFSWLTVQEMNRQRDIAEVYRQELGKGDPRRVRFWGWDAAYLGITLGLLFFLFDGLWLWSGRPNPGKTVELNIPITVQAGNTPAASFQVPVTVTVPVRTDK